MKNIHTISFLSTVPLHMLVNIRFSLQISSTMHTLFSIMTQEQRDSVTGLHVITHSTSTRRRQFLNTKQRRSSQKPPDSKKQNTKKCPAASPPGTPYTNVHSAHTHRTHMTTGFAYIIHRETRRTKHFATEPSFLPQEDL